MVAIKGKKVSRKIYYYDIECFNVNNDSRNLEEIANPQRILKETFENYKEIYENIETRHKLSYEQMNGNKLFIIVDEINSDRVNFRAVLSRIDLLPFVEKDGNLEKLSNYIDDDQNIAELTHCILYLQTNILGIEMNHSGAKANAIINYINHKSNIDFIECTIKLEKDQYKKLIEDKKFTLFKIALKANSKAMDDILSKKTVFTNMRSYGVDTLELQLKCKHTKNNTEGMDIPLSIDEMKKLSSDYVEDLETLKVSQGRIVNDCIDLLADKLVSVTEYYSSEERSIISAKVYDSINKSYNLVLLNG